MSVIFHFFIIIQNIKHRIVANRIIGNAIPMNEKKGVLKGDTYHAGKDKKSRKMDSIVIANTIAFIILRPIVYKKLLLFFTGIK